MARDNRTGVGVWLGSFNIGSRLFLSDCVSDALVMEYQTVRKRRQHLLTLPASSTEHIGV